MVNSMGSMYAQGLKDSGLDRRVAIETHLAVNHYPPIPREMTDACIEAIDAAEAGDYERPIHTPFEHVEYGFDVPAIVIIEHAHLHTWIDGGFDY